MDLSLAAVGLWTLAGTWCAQYLTDGEIHMKAIQRLGGAKKQARELVNAGLWTEKNSETYQFCGWDEYQPTKAIVEAERAQARERMKELRSKRKGTSKTETPEPSEETEDVRANTSRTDGASSDEQQPHEERTPPERSEEVRVAPTPSLSPSPVPNPTKEEKTCPTESDETEPKPIKYSPAFEAFWDAYPRKVGKKAASTAFEKARKIATVQAICTGAARYRDDPNLPPEEFRPHATTWLNEGRWEDGPQPPRGEHQQQTRPTGSQVRAAAGFERLADYDQTGRTTFTPQLELGA
jgi:hypothetical protein